jgi:metal-responsive CopG/Arc/MetJ family transcriptional regulator
MVTRFTISLPDDVAERVNKQMQGYGDNRSAWFEEAALSKLAREAEV